MPNLVITSQPQRFEIDYNDYGGPGKYPGKETVFKQDIKRLQRRARFVRIIFTNDERIDFTTDTTPPKNTLIVDSIDAEAMTTQNQLYNKFRTIL